MKHLKAVIESKKFSKKIRYSIRKLSIGVASVAVACSVIFGGPLVSSSIVKAAGNEVVEETTKEEKSDFDGKIEGENLTQKQKEILFTVYDMVDSGFGYSRELFEEELLKEGYKKEDIKAALDEAYIDYKEEAYNRVITIMNETDFNRYTYENLVGQLTHHYKFEKEDAEHGVSQYFKNRKHSEEDDIIEEGEKLSRIQKRISFTAYDMVDSGVGYSRKLFEEEFLRMNYKKEDIKAALDESYIDYNAEAYARIVNIFYESKSDDITSDEILEALINEYKFEKAEAEDAVKEYFKNLSDDEIITDGENLSQKQREILYTAYDMVDSGVGYSRELFEEELLKEGYKKEDIKAALDEAYIDYVLEAAQRVNALKEESKLDDHDYDSLLETLINEYKFNKSDAEKGIKRYFKDLEELEGNNDEKPSDDDTTIDDLKKDPIFIEHHEEMKGDVEKEKSEEGRNEKPADKKSPKTGDLGLITSIGSLTVASAAYVALKKRLKK